MQIDSDPGVFLFDIEATFPSAAQAWMGSNKGVRRLAHCGRFYTIL